MDLVVPDHIAYCFSAGRPIFLDIARDRYFTVNGQLGAAFCAFLERTADPVSDDLEALVRHGVLTASVVGMATRPSVTPARHDNPVGRAPGFDLSETLSVALAIGRAHRRLRREPFAATIASLKAQRAQRSVGSTDEVARLCAGFQLRRSMIPVRSVCLLDSIALLDFLRARGAHADLVFGVVASPFAAHCWLQREDRVLNDHLDRVLSFTPIMVV